MIKLVQKWLLVIKRLWCYVYVFISVSKQYESPLFLFFDVQ